MLFSFSALRLLLIIQVISLRSVFLIIFTSAMKIDIIAGARPNFVKIAPVIHEIRKAGLPAGVLDYRLIHTGQHCDAAMSDVFFDQLDIPPPDEILIVSGRTQAEITAQVMMGYESALKKETPDMCLVAGDVTSTLACAIVARKAGAEVAHIEGGLRSGDWTMPEEINRVATDSITNIFFTTSAHANENLLRADVASDRIFFVGNTMIDSLLKYQDAMTRPGIFDSMALADSGYFLLTMHRPANVDNAETLHGFLSAVSGGAGDIPVVFPVHPRTQKMLSSGTGNYANIVCIPPLSYLDFIYMLKHAKAVITDSGGVTEEATVLNIPCMTLRSNTERPETCIMGTNELLGTDPAHIPPALEKVLRGGWKKGSIPPLWDGKASERIVSALVEISKSKK
jgi:UDP-N-acetylglucosamine 2-epimerase (non-hydrolysing)